MIMCGIYSSRTRKEGYEKMKHRGPDMSEVVTLPSGVVLGFHRLAIQDLTQSGMQPFSVVEGDQTVTWICNGEIYDVDVLKGEFDGEIFTSSSDSEVIGHLYLRYGREGMVARLDGEFAIILVSEVVGKDAVVYACRDRFGVRPLYLGTVGDEWTFASELKGIPRGVESVKQIEPGMTYRILCSKDGDSIDATSPTASHVVDIPSKTEDVYKKIVTSFESAVKRRLVSDRPLACLLSGGLDSSLVCAVAQKYTTEPLHTYTIGLAGGTDLEKARLVADHIGSVHHEIIMTNEEALEAIDQVIWSIESWDTTTVRASTFQYLIGKYIATHTEHRVILTGEGSDELTGGYLYFKDAPTAQQFDDECRRLLRDIYLTDGLRVDRAMAAHGLEVRIPFLDHGFTETYLSLPCDMRQAQGECEKYLLRSAFADTGYLPDEILWRKKEAFSDGVSTIEHSWYQILQEAIEQEISDDELAQVLRDAAPHSPKTKEQLYFRKKFVSHFGEQAVESIPYYWMPRRQEGVTDPSARVLDVYET